MQPAQTPTPSPAPGKPLLPFGEFIALLALLMAMVAFSIDAMLPLLAPMEADLPDAAPGQVHLVVTIFLIGMGVGTLFAGPISDAFGRKPIILAGIALYTLGALIAGLAEGIDMLLLGRFLQGLGAAGPRVASQALVRDLYAGRPMARVMSFSMTIFVLIPAVAPLIGSGIGALFGWRAIFVAFVGFGLINALWLGLRQPETLPRERRMPISLGRLWSNLREILRNRAVMLYLAAISFSFGCLFTWITSVAPLFEAPYGRSAAFPWWFALAALISAPAGLLNGRLVVRLGMTRLSVWGLLAQAISGLLMLLVLTLDLAPGQEFPFFMTLMIVQFFANGLVLGNLNALALEPMGHMAGFAASFIAAISTIAAGLLSLPFVQALNGSALPVTLAMVLFSAAALACLWLAGRQAKRGLRPLSKS